MPSGVREPLVVAVFGAGLGLTLARGGFDPWAQTVFGVLGLAALALARPRCGLDAILAGLVAVAAANAVAFAVHHADARAGAALAAVSLPAWYAAARELTGKAMQQVGLITVMLAATVATTGLAALATRTTPYAERIAGVWRAGGTFEYPPALAVFAVCGVALVLGLTLSGELSRAQGLSLALLLLAGVAATFDRLGYVAAGSVLGVFAVRFPGAHRIVAAALAGMLVAALAAVAIAGTPRSSLREHLGHDPLAGRSPVWRASLEGIRDHPLTGVGPGRFTALYQHRPVAVGQAHDAALQQGVEAGILAAAGMVLAMAAATVRAVRRSGSADPQAVAWAGWLLLLVGSAVVDFTWSYPPLVLLALVAAAALRPGSALPVR